MSATESNIQLLMIVVLNGKPSRSTISPKSPDQDKLLGPFQANLKKQRTFEERNLGLKIKLWTLDPKHICELILILIMRALKVSSKTSIGLQ